jgi:murein DD-endopeptidase MepM/ murein hydrolase activator NlpD
MQPEYVNLLASNLDYMPETLSEILKNHRTEFAPVVDLNLNAANVARLDFSASNPILTPENLRDTNTFNQIVDRMLRDKNAEIGIGGYLENRVIYRRSQLFEEDEPRSLHLGIDIWAPAGTSVFSPLPATVHSFQDNANFGDYGPTIILEHQLEGKIFYTLYGHLNRSSLPQLYEGKVIVKGEKIAEFGPYPENGDWPPHLHFQIILNLQGMKGDFPGVCKPSEKAIYLSLCPDPNLILNCQALE